MLRHATRPSKLVYALILFWQDTFSSAENVATDKAPETDPIN